MNWQLCEVGEIVNGFLRNADQDTRDAFDQRASILLAKGNLCREPISEHLRDGIFQLRIRTGKDQTRFLYYFDEPRRIVIVVVISLKKTQKTPPEEIKKAIRIRSEIQRRERTKNAKTPSRYIN